MARGYRHSGFHNYFQFIKLFLPVFTIETLEPATMKNKSACADKKYFINQVTGDNLYGYTFPEFH